MFREMRLKENQLTTEDAIEMFKTNSHGILALDGEEGYTYAVPVNYAYEDHKIYFHGAIEGKKMDALKQNNKLSFCVVDRGEIVPAEFNCLFRSAIAFGRARVLTDAQEKQKALELILQKYSPDFMESGRAYVKSEWDNVAAVEIAIDHMTAKKGI